jgi:hypothetical protein
MTDQAHSSGLLAEFDLQKKDETRALSIRVSFILEEANPLAGAAVQLLIEALGIEGVGRSGNTGQNRKSDDG